ncbi:MAG: ABC transporter ATP-binding protein [Kiritimatiellia bacterium]|jgi:fluoroquinolone transport system ATP-binding protein|nr:ABC transporter ATP-binding protein [Kiritimatiellia bacterium]
MIDVEELTFTYPGRSASAVCGVSFSVAEGEIFGFLGPNGAGKSTTQMILTGLLGNYQGKAELFGREVSGWGSDLYEQVGVGFELPVHYGRLTARENLRYFSALYRGETADIEELLDAVDLLDQADVRVDQYSKGMRVRLSFARAVLCQPRLLFLDEPTTGLDPLSARRLKDLILVHRRRGATIFLTTHDMLAADELCDRVAFIVDGRISLTDSPRELKVRYGEHTVKVEYEEAGQLRAEEFPLEGLANSPGFLVALSKPGLQTIHSQETTLDQIFIRVTGRELK